MNLFGTKIKENKEICDGLIDDKKNELGGEYVIGELGLFLEVGGCVEIRNAMLNSDMSGFDCLEMGIVEFSSSFDFFLPTNQILTASQIARVEPRRNQLGSMGDLEGTFGIFVKICPPQPTIPKLFRVNLIDL